MLKKLQKKAGSMLEFPPEALTNGPKVTITGNSEVCVEYFRDVLSISDTEIIISTTEGNLILTGENLTLKVMLPLQMRIEGRLRNVRYAEGEGK